MPNEQVNPLAMPLPDAARLLAKLLNKPVTEEMLKADVEAGAPLNANGSINVLAYSAWLIREMDKARS